MSAWPWLQERLAAGPYSKNPRKAHWDYVLIEMRWMVGQLDLTDCSQCTGALFK